MAWIYLATAIIAEVIGTMSLKVSNGFNNSLASIICVIGYGISFYFLSLVVKTIPIGIAYAVWAGCGIVLITAIGAFWFKQTPDLAAITGAGLIISGVVIINLFSSSINH